MKNNRFVFGNFPLLEVKDSADNYAYFPSLYYPPKLDSWECKLEILKLDFDQFDLCTRPDDFVFTLNGIVATCSYSGTLPQKLITWQSTNTVYHYQVRVRTIYPNPITASDKPHFVVDLIATPHTVPESAEPRVTGLDSTTINIIVTDTLADGMVLFRFNLDISSTFDRVIVTNLKPDFLSPEALIGDFFTVQ